MNTSKNTFDLQARTRAIYDEQQRQTYQRTDRLFAGLLAGEWLAAIAIALWVSPYTWAGATHSVHVHVWFAFALGGAIVALPLWLASRHPGEPVTRHAVAIAQMLLGALFIHLAGGRLEVHFHVFGSLAFLAFYRDWRVLVTASLVVAADHLLRGMFWPESVYGVLRATPWRAVEHAAWVVFEDVFLLIGLRHSRAERLAAAADHARLEGVRADIEAQVEQRTAELRESEERFRDLFEHSSDLVQSLAPDGRFLFVNPAWHRTLGYTPEELPRLTIFDLIAPECRAHCAEAFERVMRGEKLDAVAVQFLARDGRVVYLEGNTHCQFRDGRPLATRAIFRDCTARRQVDAERERARVAALESARLKSEFLANMSHEIRTPMNGILGMLALVGDTALSPQQRDFVETARSSADSLLTVLNDILDFSKIEAGKLAIEETDFDPRDLVETTLELLAASAQAKGLELMGEVRTEPGLVLRGDPTRLRQVLMNLLGNAIKFTAQGEVVVRAAVEPLAEGGLVLRCAVRDTGIGIPADVVPKLFQAFTQADGSTSRRFGGTGLGLAISRRLVELMGGEIHVTSELQRGSVFSFGARVRRSDAPLAAPRRASLLGRRVLVVDDNATNRAVLHHQLAAFGMADTLAADGREALERLRAAAGAGAPFALAVLDLQMPGMDGLELAYAIRADAALAETSVVILTSLGLRIDEATQRAAGIRECLFKPVRQARLFDALSRAVAAAPAVAAEAPAASAAVARAVQPLRILLAEDNAVNQKVVLGQLRKLGRTADVAADGRAALEAHTRSPYDVILMDCQMPEMEGYEVSQRIRQGEACAGNTRPVRIVALTAHALQEERAKCLAAGMDDYLSKPVKTSDLEQALDRALAAQPPSPLP